MTKTYPLDVAELLTTPEAQAAFLTEALETGDAGEISYALGVVSRAYGMTALATATGLKRESLYRALQKDGSPKLETALKVLAALGVRLVAVPKEGSATA